MEPEIFDAELKQLSQMVGSFKSDELFNACYLELLEKVRAENDAALKYAQASRMRALLMYQAQFLMNQWLIEKRKYEVFNVG